MISQRQEDELIAAFELTARGLRRQCEKAWNDETRCPGWGDNPPSTGHCGVMAALAHKMYNWEIVTAKAPAGSHWLNRVKLGPDNFLYIDLTADQFGGDMPPVLITKDTSRYLLTKPTKYTKPIGESLKKRIEILEKRAKILYMGSL